MATITSVGVGSGIDLESLLGSIIEAEGTATDTQLTLREAETQATISAFGSIKSTLSAFQDNLENLQDSDFFSNRSALSSNEEVFTATADGTADLSSYEVAVLALAQNSKVGTNASFADPDALVGAGTLTIGFTNGGDSFNIVTDGTTTLGDLRDAINAASDNIGVTASLITLSESQTELVLTSNNTGAANQITISVDDDDLADTDDSGLSRFYFDGDNPAAGTNQADSITVAQDASITVDNFTISSSTNVFSDAIAGVTITAVAESDNPAEPDDLIVSTDTSGVESEIKTFVASYNELMIVFNQLTDYDSTTQTSGLLNSDSSARIIESQIRRVMSDLVDDAPSDFNSLAYLGISTNQNGTISLDTEQLSEAVSSNFDDLSSLFASDSGVATKMDALLDTFLQSGGTIDVKENFLQTELSEIAQDRIDLQARLDKIEERVRAQFTALDILVAQLNQTGTFLQDQLSASAQIISRNSDS